jgi:hypothetical protein
MPVPARFAGRRRGFGFGVLSGPKSSLGKWFAVLFGRAQKKVGYLAGSRIAIDLLAARSPEAASWWRQNTPQFTKSGRYFIFAAESCEELHDAT